MRRRITDNRDLLACNFLRFVPDISNCFEFWFSDSAVCAGFDWPGVIALIFHLILWRSIDKKSISLSSKTLSKVLCFYFFFLSFDHLLYSLTLSKSWMANHIRVGSSPSLAQHNCYLAWDWWNDMMSTLRCWTQCSFPKVLQNLLFLALQDTR